MTEPPKKQRSVEKGKGKLARTRAFESIKTSAFGAAELVAGVVFHFGSAALIGWFVDFLGRHGPDNVERMAVLGLQWAATAAFVVHGTVNIVLGIGLAVRSAYRDWNQGE